MTQYRVCSLKERPVVGLCGAGQYPPALEVSSSQHISLLNVPRIPCSCRSLVYHFSNDKLDQFPFYLLSPAQLPSSWSLPTQHNVGFANGSFLYLLTLRGSWPSSGPEWQRLLPEPGDASGAAEVEETSATHPSRRKRFCLA